MPKRKDTEAVAIGKFHAAMKGHSYQSKMAALEWLRAKWAAEERTHQATERAGRPIPTEREQETHDGK